MSPCHLITPPGHDPHKLTSAGAHDGHGAVSDIGGGELSGEGGHGGLEPGEHADGDPERGDRCLEWPTRSLGLKLQH